MLITPLLEQGLRIKKLSSFFDSFVESLADLKNINLNISLMLTDWYPLVLTHSVRARPLQLPGWQPNIASKTGTYAHTQTGHLFTLFLT